MDQNKDQTNEESVFKGAFSELIAQDYTGLFRAIVAGSLYDDYMPTLKSIHSTNPDAIAVLIEYALLGMMYSDAIKYMVAVPIEEIEKRYDKQSHAASAQLVAFLEKSEKKE